MTIQVPQIFSRIILLHLSVSPAKHRQKIPSYHQKRVTLTCIQLIPAFLIESFNALVKI